MRARMNIGHRAARFGSHTLTTGQAIATAGAELAGDFVVTGGEMQHHLQVKNATPIKAGVERAVAPSGEVAIVEQTPRNPKTVPPRTRPKLKPRPKARS